MNEAIQKGLEEDAQLLLGGDIQARLSYREVNDEERAALNAAGDVSEQISMRSMARSVNLATDETKERTLIELKAVDGFYPLYGAMELSPDQPLANIIASRDGYWGCCG